MRLALLVVVAVVCAACGDSGNSLDSVKIGMTPDQVRERVGKPWRVLDDLNGPQPDEPGQADPCWLYPVEDNYRYICFGANGRVARISTSIHL